MKHTKPVLVHKLSHWNCSWFAPLNLDLRTHHLLQNIHLKGILENAKQSLLLQLYWWRASSGSISDLWSSGLRSSDLWSSDLRFFEFQVCLFFNEVSNHFHCRAIRGQMQAHFVLTACKVANCKTAGGSLCYADIVLENCSATTFFFH